MKPYRSVRVNEVGGVTVPRLLVSCSGKLTRYARRLYFFDLKDRDPTVYEWDASGFSVDSYLDLVRKELGKAPTGISVGFVVAFPHVFTDFTWGDQSQETNLYQRAYRVTRHKIGEGDIYEATLAAAEQPEGVPQGCLVEQIVKAAEANLWAQEETVPDYMKNNPDDFTWFMTDEKEVVNPSKLSELIASQEQLRLVFPLKS